MSDQGNQPELDLDALIAEGVERLQARDFAAAVRIFEEVLSRDPSNVLAVKYLRFAQLGNRGGASTIVTNGARSTQKPGEFQRMRPARRKERSGESRLPLSLGHKREE